MLFCLLLFLTPGQEQYKKKKREREKKREKKWGCTVVLVAGKICLLLCLFCFLSALRRDRGNCAMLIAQTCKYTSQGVDIL